jgi:PHD/YefM family antitoxin component YafN of YafNO toxin-antitoxin module
MNKLPQMASVADMRQEHLRLFTMLKNGPVVVSNRSKPAAVMLSPEMWDKIVEQLEEQDDLIQVLQAELDRATGKARPSIRSHEEIDAWVKDEQPVLA